MRHYASFMDREVIRRAYACSIMLGIRAGGHAVNVKIDDFSVDYETVSWRCFAVAKGLRAVMADLDIAAPVTLDELAACAGVEDRMCGSDLEVIESDLEDMKKAVGESIVEALAELVDNKPLLEMVSDFPVSELIEEISWVA